MPKRTKLAKPAGNDRDATFTSLDRFERLTREEIAEILNAGLAEHLGTLNVKPFEPGDPRLTDEVCYTVVNEWSNNGSPKETTENVLAEHPELLE